MNEVQLHAWVEEGLSLKQIGRLVGRQPSTVSYWLAKYGLSAPGKEKHAPRGAIERATLVELVEQGASIGLIAETLGRGTASVRHWLARYGLETRATARRRELRNRSEETIELHCHIHGLTRHRRSARGTLRCLICRSEAVTRRRRKVKEVLIHEAGGACAVCGYDRCPGALHFHHLDPALKQFELSAAGFARSLERARAEARKCALLCSNCHAEVESGTVTLSSATRDGGRSEVARSGVAQLADALDC
jgi:transposase